MNKIVCLLFFPLFFSIKAEYCINYSPMVSNIVDVSFVLDKQIISAKIKNLTSDKLSLSGVAFLEHGYPF